MHPLSTTSVHASHCGGVRRANGALSTVQVGDKRKNARTTQALALAMQSELFARWPREEDGAGNETATAAGKGSGTQNAQRRGRASLQGRPLRGAS
jgi:ABC-type protease/lipase transport system fused ATPase/permease subunit